MCTNYITDKLDKSSAITDFDKTHRISSSIKKLHSQSPLHSHHLSEMQFKTH